MCRTGFQHSWAAAGLAAWARGGQWVPFTEVPLLSHPFPPYLPSPLAAENTLKKKKKSKLRSAKGPPA